jgi:tetratricopeptide (TPR) repeat protein
MTVGARLRRLRVAKGLTQKQLAEPRYSHAYVSTIEAGRRAPSQAALEHFGAKLGIPIDELVTGRPVDLAPRLGLRLQEARIRLSAGGIHEAESEFNAVKKNATRFGLGRLAARAVECLALCEERRGRLDEAVELYDEAIDMLREETPLAAVEPIAGKARCVRLRGDIRYSIYLLESQLERLEREDLSDPDSLVRIYASLTKSYFDSGLFTKAGEAAEEALRLAPRVSDAAKLAQMHVNLTGTLIQRGELPDAEAALLRAEDLYRQAELQAELARAQLARGFVLSRARRYDEARELLAAARGAFEETSSPLDEARSLNEIARIDRITGQTDSAVAALERAISLLDQSDVAEQALAHRELALCYMSTQPADAEKHLRIAIDLFERAEEATQLATTYRILGDLLQHRGDHDGSCDAYRTGIVLLEERL